MELIIKTRIMKNSDKFFIWYVLFASLLKSNDMKYKYILQVWRSNPYLATERFPHNWAIADMVKGYIAGTRKEHLRQAREEEEECQRQTATKRSKKGAGDSDNDEGKNDIPLPSSNTKIRKSRTLPEPDPEENDGQQSLQSTKTRKSRRGPQPEQEEEGSSASTSRDCHGYEKPADKCRGLGWGWGTGWSYRTPRKPVPHKRVGG